MNNMKILSDAEIFDIKEERLLFKSVSRNSPKQLLGWTAAARLEEKAGDISGC